MLPFTWWPDNLYLLGGDDTKFEYIAPYLKLAPLFYGDAVMLAGSESGLIHEISSIPSYIVIAVLHTVLPFLNTQHLVHALVLAGGFLGCFWMLSMVPVVGRTQGYVPLFVRFVAANVYAFSTFNIVTMWDHQLPSYMYIATLPFIVGFIMRSVQKYTVVDSVAAALLLAFSPTPYGSVPWLIPVVICGLPLVIALALERPKDLFYTLATFLIASVVLLFPTIIAMVEFRGYSAGMFASDQVKESVRVFTELNKNNDLIYPLALTPPQDFLLSKLSLYREMPGLFRGVINTLAATMGALFVAAVLVVRRRENRGNRRIIVGVLLSWGISVIFYAGGGNGVLHAILVAGMEEFSFMIMLRNNYDKFNIAISLFSSLMVFYSLMYIYCNFNGRETATTVDAN